MSKTRITKHITIFLSLLSTVAFFGCGGPPTMPMEIGSEAAAAPIEVQTTYAERGDLSRENLFAGRVEASQTIKIYPEVSGTVAKTYVSVGDYVQKGDILFEFDSKDAQTALQKAELNYQKTMNDLASAESGSANAITELNYQTAITTAQNSYEQARDNLEVATGDDFDFSEFRKTRKKLKEVEQAYDADESTENWEKYVAALQDYDDLIDDYASYTKYKELITAFENSYDNYLQAVEKYEIYKSMTTEEDAANRDISRSQAEMTLEDAKETVANQKVYSPVSGIISSKNIDEFDIADTKTIAYTVSNEGLPSVSFSLSESGARSLDIQDTVTVIYLGEEYDAVVTEISPEADATGLYLSKAQLTEDIGTDRSGAVVKVRATTAYRENALILPLDIINYEGNQPYVYIYENGVARRADLELGITTAESAAVVSGISADDAIITTWNPGLNDGAAVYSADMPEENNPPLIIDNGKED